MQTLNQELDTILNNEEPTYFKHLVPAYIYANLKNGFGQRPYQQESFGRFIYHFDKTQKGPTQLLYHMATGSGKTLIMAGLIIYLYEKGYRNFLFFVNSNNIIDKTRDNFFNSSSSKYLFSDSVSIADKQIQIKEVDNFQTANTDNINIVFSTIQGLHSRLNTARENSLTYEDFEDRKIVLISDEAHHINAETKKSSELGAEEKEELISWEGTVNRIFNANKENVLLEFTATADLSIPEILKKYSNKLIFDYPLKQFRKEGYSKEVKVLQADLPAFSRALQAVLLSQYRRKVFEKYKKQIKPVILFKSKTIKESHSFYDAFITGIRNLKVADLENIKNANTDGPLAKVFQYFKTNNIGFENLITELQEDFSAYKLLSVNSKDESIEKQLAVNSLEDESNEYRAIFAVDKLNEGWDVLNLFDIVRLYDTRDAKAGKPGKTTMAEAQLIGRGARYCPFQILPDQDFYCRKYDEDLLNELRICEELYYHSSYNPRYIQELNKALEVIGIKEKDTIEVSLNLKEIFKKSTFYKSGFIFLNQQKNNSDETAISFQSKLKGKTFRVSLKTGISKSNLAFEAGETTVIKTKEIVYSLIDFGEPILRKAISKLEFYQFSNLKIFLPHLNSITEFINSEEYLSKIKLTVSGLKDQVENLSAYEKLDTAIKILNEISDILISSRKELFGTKTFQPHLIKDCIKDKLLNVNPNETISNSALDNKDWYVFQNFHGTAEQKNFLTHFDKLHKKINKTFEEIYQV